MGSLRSIMAEPLIIENEIVGVVLVAWRTNGEPFKHQDENALHDFTVLFGSTQRLLQCVEELVNVIELEMAIPRSSIPALSSLASPAGEKASASPGSKKTLANRSSTTL